MLSVVYLDDEKALTDIFKLLFENTAYTVKTFTEESDALNYCLNTPPDILFIDYRLKEMKGDEVAAQLPDSIYKILVTGDIKVESKYYFNQVIKKPFKLNELLKATHAAATIIKSNNPSTLGVR